MLKDFASYSEDNLSHIMERYNIIMGGNDSQQCLGYRSALLCLLGFDLQKNTDLWIRIKVVKNQQKCFVPEMQI